MNRRMLHCIGLVLLALGMATPVRNLIAGGPQSGVGIAISCSFALFGFVLLVLGNRVQAHK